MNKSETQAFTDKQLADWRAYEGIRLSGQFNMFDRLAGEASRLEKHRYSFVMENYDALKLAANNAAIKETK